MSQPKKSRLDELQAEIAESLEIAESAKDLRAEAEIAKAELAAERQRLSVLQAQVNKTETTHKENLRTYKEREQAATDEVDSLRRQITAQGAQKAQADLDIASAKDTLDDYYRLITEAKTLKLKLNAQNQQLIKDYETTKRDLESKVMTTQNQVNDLLAEIQRQAYTHEQNSTAIEQQERQLADQTAIAKQRQQQHQLDLAAMDIEVDNKRNLMASFDAEMNKRKMDMDAQQESIEIRRQVMIQEKTDIDARRRKLDLDTRLANRQLNSL